MLIDNYLLNYSLELWKVHIYEMNDNDLPFTFIKSIININGGGE